MYYILRHWSPAWPVLVAWLLVAAVHLYGLLRLSRAEAMQPGGHAERRVAGLRREAAAFHIGLLSVLLVLVSPVGYWAQIYIWVRAMQDLVLAFVAPALLVLGAPWLPLASALPGHGRTRSGAAEQDAAGGSRRWWLAWPLAVVIVFNVAWLGWHIPALYDASARDGAARYAEYACYLGIGVAFWLQLIGSRPSRPVLNPLTRLKYLTATVVADTILGMMLVFGSAVVYHAYGGAAHHVLSVLSDQQVAGAVLWMGVLPPLIIAAVALLHTWLENEESDELSRDLDRVLGRPAAAAWQPGQGRGVWHARPGYRRPTI
jgi:putative membrane protein